MKGLLAVDIGVVALGYAYWELLDRPCPPTHSAIIEIPRKHRRGLEGPEKAARLAEALKREVDRLVFTVENVAVEYPQKQGGQRGEAASRRGDILDLAGNAVGIVVLFPGVSRAFYKPATWKGSMNKINVARRLRRLGIEFGDPEKDHRWDAVGVGFFHAGFKLTDSEIFGRNVWKS